MHLNKSSLGSSVILSEGVQSPQSWRTAAAERQTDSNFLSQHLWLDIRPAEPVTPAVNEFLCTNHICAFRRFQRAAFFYLRHERI